MIESTEIIGGIAGDRGYCDFTRYNATVLTHSTIELRKKYILNDDKICKIGYQNPKNFSAKAVEFKSIDDFWCQFQDISNNPRQMLIRGVSRKHIAKYSKTQRMLEIFGESEGGSNWFQIDVDAFEGIPTTINPLTVEGIEYFIEQHLPHEFKNVSYVFQFSNSAGIINKNGIFLKNGLSVHLYFFTDRNVTNAELKHYIPKLTINELNIIDHSLFNSVQPHYTALPDIGENIECVLEKRQDFVLKENDVVKVPQIEIQQIKPQVITTNKPNISSGYSLKNEYQKTTDLDQKKLIEKLKHIGCIYRISETTVNLHHPQETSPGGWFFYLDSPKLIHHHNHGSMFLSQWLSQYYNYHEIVQTKEIRPYYNTPRIDPLSAQQELIVLIDKFIHDKENMIIKASAAIGKTTLVIKYLLSPTRTIHILVPTHNLANELKNNIQLIYPDLNGLVLKGRSQEGMCKFAKVTVDGKKLLIDELAKRGISIFSHMCKKKSSDGSTEAICPQFTHCPYLKQFNRDSHYNYVILTHNALVNFQTDDLKLPDPDYVVIDESFWQHFVGHKRLSLNDLNSYLNDRAEDNEKEILRLVRDAMQDNVPLLKYLRDNGITKVKLDAAKNIAGNNSKNKCEIQPGMPEKQMKEAFARIKQDAGVYRLFKCISSEIDKSREKPHSIQYVTKYDETFLILNYRNNLLRYKVKKVPFLIIDADAEKMLIEKVLKREFIYHEINVQRKSTVTQVYSSAFSTSRLIHLGNDEK